MSASDANVAQAQNPPRATGVDIAADCAPCHGAQGIARDVEVPHLAGQNDRYLVYQLRAFRSGSRRHQDMRVMARHLSDDEIEAIAAYYYNLPR